MSIPGSGGSRCLAVTFVAYAVCAPLFNAFAESNDAATQALLEKASSTYCKDYTDETVNYLLTQGTPDDVTMMEYAVGYLEDGQWKIDSKTLSSSSGDVDGEFVVQVRCTWTTPIEELNAPVDLQYKAVIDRQTQTVISVEDAN